MNDFIASVRRRPGLFVGEVGTYGLHRLPLILLHTATLAAREGRGDEVDLHLEEDGACTVSFHGTLWPSRFAADSPADTLTRLFCPAGFVPSTPRPDFEPQLDVSPPYEDLAVVNALSSEFEVTHWSNGNAWRQRFRCGEPVDMPRELPARELGATTPLGTRIRFMPDRSLFEHTRFSSLALSWRMEELAALSARVTYRLRDDVLQREERYRFEQGLGDYCARLSAPALPLHPPWYFEGHRGTTRVRLALQWCREPGSRLVSWVNMHRAHAGTHLSGLLGGLDSALSGVETSRPHLRIPLYIPSELLNGLTVLLEVSIPQPIWVGPLKGDLANEESDEECEGTCDVDVAALVRGWLRQRFEAEPVVAERILEHALGRYIARG